MPDSAEAPVDFMGGTGFGLYFLDVGHCQKKISKTRRLHTRYANFDSGYYGESLPK
jgi:hypothetical protein